MPSRRFWTPLLCMLVWSLAGCDKSSSEETPGDDPPAATNSESASNNDAEAATKAPSTSDEEPAAPKKADTTPKPTGTAAAAAEKPAASPAPAGDKQPAAAEKPAAETAPAGDKQPAAAEKPAAKTAPAGDKQPAATEKPAAKTAPAGDKQPAAAEKPAAKTAAPGKDAAAKKSASPEPGTQTSKSGTNDAPASDAGDKKRGEGTTPPPSSEREQTDRADSKGAASTKAAEVKASKAPSASDPPPSKADKAEGAAPPVAAAPSGRGDDAPPKAASDGTKAAPKGASAEPKAATPQPESAGSKAAVAPTAELAPGLVEGGEVWALRSAAPARWGRGVVARTCGTARYEVSFGDGKKACMSGALIASLTPKSSQVKAGQRVLVLTDTETIVAGTIHRVSNDALVQLDADGATAAVSFDRMRMLGAGQPLAAAVTAKDQNVWAQHGDGHFRFALRQGECPGGFWALVAPEQRRCLAAAQLAPDRYIGTVQPGARVLKVPDVGDTDALPATVISVSEDKVAVAWDAGTQGDVPIKKLRLLAGPGQMAAPVVHKAKRCAKLNLRNKAFNSRGAVGFKFKNRCLRPIKCQMNIEYYCAHDESDSKTDWFACDRVAAPGESMTCSDKRCRRPRKGDEATYRAIRCSFATSP